MRKLLALLAVLASATAGYAGWYGGGGGTSSFDPSTNTFPVQAPSFTSTAADNTRGWEGQNTGPVDNSYQKAGWMSTRTDNNVYLRSSDNTVTFLIAPSRQPWGFTIKNPTVSDNVFVWPRIPWGIHLRSFTCRASMDNVVGFLGYSAADNVMSMTNAFAATTFDNSVAGVTVALDNAVPQHSWIKWFTQSVGSATQFLQCGGEYEIR